MAVKIKPNANPGSTEVVVVDTAKFLLVSADQLVNVTSPDSRLPVLKLIHPIEVDGTNIKPEHAYAFGIFSGESFSPLPADIVLSVLAARDSTRQLQVEINGTKVPNDDNNPQHKGAKKGYNRLFKAIGKYNASDLAYAESLKDASYQRGIDYLVAVFQPDGSVALADLPAYKTQASYWHKALQPALLQRKLGAKILIANHAVNIVSAKGDASHKYVAPQKFDQFHVEELTQEQLLTVQEALSNSTADIEAWFSR